MPVETHAPKIVNRAATSSPAAASRSVQCQPVRNRTTPRVQASLKVSSPRDPAEKEADATARKIMRMAVPESSVAYLRTESGGVFRQVKGEEKEKTLQRFESPYIARFAGCTPMRKAEGQPNVASNVAAEIQSSTAGGSPLPLSVRRFMEPRFRADFSKVRIHTDAKAAKLNRQVNARAFAVGNSIFFGESKFKPDTHEGRELIAHELTHTIQQGAALQRSEEPMVTQHAPVQVQRLGLTDALDYFADKANLIPGFRMFTIVLGVNPINMSRVDRNAANILRALIEFIPGGGLITQALDNYGIFDKIGTWVEQQIRSLGMVGSAIKQAVTQFLSTLSWTDIFDLGGVWDRAKRIFTEPIDRIKNFAKGLVTGIVQFIKDAILRPLAKLAEGTRGYDLLKAILCEDPITGEPVPRTADTLIGGFMKLIGQEDVWENIKKGNAIARAWAWFQGALAGLMGLVRAVPRRIIDTIRSLTLMDVVTVVDAFRKVVGTFVNIAGDFVSWGLKQVLSLLEILFSVVAPGVMPYLSKARAPLTTILKDPIGFVGNLVRAGRMGFELFAANILTHLKAALIKWIVGPLGDAGVYIPRSFELMEIIKLVLSVLGLTWQNIRGKLVKIIPDPVLTGLEKTAGVLVTLVKDGPAAAWDQIKAELAELKDQMIAQVTAMVTTEVVKAAVVKLVSMLNPAGAVIQAILAIYNTVTFFIQKINQIAAVVASFIDSIAAIASGQVAGAAKKVEQTMANGLTVVIAFLAKFAGLGSVPEKLVGIIKKIRAPIDRGLDKIVAWLGNLLKKLAGAVKAGVKKLLEWWKIRKTFAADGESHSLSFSGEKTAAQLVVASDPTPLRKFLEEKRNEAGITPQKLAATGQIEILLRTIDLARLLPDDKNEQAQADIEAAFALIVPLLITLLSGTEFGTQANPLPLEYTKRSIGRYPIIYVGPKSKNRIDQEWLRLGNLAAIDKALADDAERKEWAVRGKKIIALFPTKPGTRLPDGSGPVGIEEPFRTEAGLRIEYAAGKTKGGGLINDTLKPFGFRAGAEKYDGDHIIEMQIGGPNELRNLWPLERGENRSSGSLLRDAIAKTKMKVKPGRNAPANKDNFYLLITKTRT